MRHSLALSLGVAAVTLAACGGSSSSGGSSVSGIQPPGQISVVQPLEGGAAGASLAPGAVDDFPADADYFADEQRTHVYDPAIEPLGTINMILCFMEQCAPHLLVNEGPYKALVNVAECEQGADPSSGGEGQSSGASEEFALWIVESERANESSPMHASIWAPEEEEFGTVTIHVDTTLAAPPSAENPLGLFELNFAAVPDEGGSIDDPVFWGHLAAEAGVAEDVTLVFYQEFGDVDAAHAPGEFSDRTQVNLQMNADQTEGLAKIHRDMRWNDGGGDSGIVPQDFLVAYDGTHFVRSMDAGADVAYMRETFDENVWSYGLYHASGPDAGDRVQLDSGFGFETESGEYGHVGYWGLWADEGVEIPDGATITKQVWGDGTSGEEYLVVRAPGKLIENVRGTVDVVAVEDELFNWWHEGTEYQVTFSGGSWVKVASWNDGTGAWDVIDPPQVIDTATVGYLGLWSESLGDVSFVHGDTTVTVVTQSYVNGAHDLFAGGASEVVLYGYVDQLDTGITGSEAEAGDVFLADSTDVGAPHVFRFQREDLTLYHDADGSGTTLVEVGLADGEAPVSGPFTWGMRSGPMVLDTAGLGDVWDTWAADVYYTYETGHNEWNQLTAVTDLLGDYVSFDAPIQFMYQHATANDRNGDAAFDGKSYLLEYGGPGDLWGIPSVGVDLDGDLEADRWYPEFSLADEVVLGPTGAEYVVKALDVEQTLAEDGAYAGALTTAGAGALTLPDAATYAQPDIGAEPPVTGPPRVVEGDVVGEGE